MSDEDLRNIKRAWSLCSIKEDPNDTPYDALSKISAILREVIMNSDEDFRKMVYRLEIEKVEAEAWDENERYDLRLEWEKEYKAKYENLQLPRTP